MKVIYRVEQIIRRFLWRGVDFDSGGAKVAWVDLALPLEEGGLGIKRLDVWNTATMGKHIWKLCQPTSLSSWARWVKENLLRGRSFWEISIPQNSSWTWRKLLKLREYFKPHIKYTIGDGQDAFLWFDHWLPMGPIHPSMGDRVIYDSSLPRLARVAAIIREGRWAWPSANSPDLIELKEATQ